MTPSPSARHPPSPTVAAPERPARADGEPSARWTRLAPAVVLAAAVAQALWVGWGRFGDVLVDVGRELEWARRMAAGERLYTDLRWYYGPLAPHVNAALFRAFGVHLEVLAVAGAATGAAATAVVYRLARRFVGALASTVAALVFVYALAFGHQEEVGIFNWVLPYTYAATYGMLAALLSLLFLLRHAANRRSADLAVAGLFLVLAILSKVETALPAVACHLAFLGLSPPRGPRLRPTLVVYALAALATAATFGALYLRVGPALWGENLAAVVNEDSRDFIAFMAGTDDVAGRLPLVAASAGLAVAFAALSLAAARLADRWAGFGRRRAALFAAGALAMGAVAYLAPVDVPWLVTPFALAFALGHAVVRAAREEGRRAELLPVVLLHAFALAALPRIALGAAPVGYAFYLLPGALVAVAVLLFDGLPRLVRAGPQGRAAVSVLAAALLLGNAATCYLASLAAYESKVAHVASPRGELWTYPGDAEVFARGLEWAGRLPPDACVIALPDASALNFFAARSSCSPLASYLPMELHGAFGGGALAARWQRRPPDLVFWTDREMPEFGGARFGVSYARAEAQWLRQSYRPATDPRTPGVVLLRR